MEHGSIDLDPSWLAQLHDEFHQEYMLNLKNFLSEELKRGKVIYPHGKNIFAALNQTPFDRVKVVIIGQDPYHGTGQAHGLSFSVNPGVAIPPSLQNIYKELADDLGCIHPGHGHLVHWAQQGVLLLNAVLTVEASRAFSHHGRGWELFTDRIVSLLNERREHLVFLLWGSPAQKKGASIDRRRHLVLTSPHPSPLSAYRGFFGQHHFSKANAYLTSWQQTAIDWQIPS